MIDFDLLNGFRTEYQLWVRQIMPNTGGDIVLGPWLLYEWYATLETAIDMSKVLRGASKIVKVTVKDMPKAGDSR
jgi:hypothetical protein